MTNSTLAGAHRRQASGTVAATSAAASAARPPITVRSAGAWAQSSYSDAAASATATAQSPPPLRPGSQTHTANVRRTARGRINPGVDPPAAPSPARFTKPAGEITLAHYGK